MVDDNVGGVVKVGDEIIVDRERSHFFIGYGRYFTPGMRDFLRRPDYFLDRSPGPFFKCDAADTTTIGVVEIDSKKFVVKRYNIKGAWHFLKKFWRPSNAMRTWENSHHLQQLDINTLVPVAVIEKRFLGLLRSKAYFISEYTVGVRGCDYFGKDAQPNPHWVAVVANVCSMIETMRSARVVHRDFQYGNLLIVGEQPLLLDLDHMKLHRCSSSHSKRAFERAHCKDLEHFLEFLKPNPIAYKMFVDAFYKLNTLLK